MLARLAVHFGIVIAFLCCVACASWAEDFNFGSDGAEPPRHLVLPGEPSLPRRLALGINDLGAQMRLHLNPQWAGEVRYLSGSSSSDVGTIHANVFGLRGYRFFSERYHFKLYAGLEGDYVSTSLQSDNASHESTSVANIPQFGETSGYAMGGFGGLEYRIGRRVALDLDIGPYMIGLQEKVTRVSGASLDFVLDTAINVYLF